MCLLLITCHIHVLPMLGSAPLLGHFPVVASCNTPRQALLIKLDFCGPHCAHCAALPVTAVNPGSFASGAHVLDGFPQLGYQCLVYSGHALFFLPVLLVQHAGHT